MIEADHGAALARLVFDIWSFPTAAPGDNRSSQRCRGWSPESDRIRIVLVMRVLISKIVCRFSDSRMRRA